MDGREQATLRQAAVVQKCQDIAISSPHATTVLPAGLAPQSLEPLARSEMPQQEPPVLLPTQHSPIGSIHVRPIAALLLPQSTLLK